MALTIIRFGNIIARNAAGAVCMADFASAPSPLTLTHDWTAGVTGGATYTLSPVSDVAYVGAYHYSATLYDPSADFPRGCATIDITSLVLGSGSVRWVGTFTVSSDAAGLSRAKIVANIHHDCQSGTINPRGSYVVDSYPINVPTGSYSTWVTAGTTITLS